MKYLIIFISFMILLSLSIPAISQLNYTVEYNVSILNAFQDTRVFNVNMTTRLTYGLDLSITLYRHGALSICYRVLGINSSLVNVTDNKCIAMGLDELLNNMLNGWVFPAPGSKLKITGTSTVEGKTEFLGFADYMGYPVYKLMVQLPLRLPGVNVENNLVNATLYCYTGFGLPLYIRAETGMFSSIKLIASLKSTNLPHNPVSAYTSTRDYVFLLGGMPGAIIRLEGKSGRHVVSVSNEGNGIGYLIIIDKTDGRAFAKKIDPGQNITLELQKPLSKDIILTAESKTGLHGLWLNPYYIATLIIIGVTILLVYFIHRLKK